ncbi:MAG: hypothetical protein AAF430_19130 [Myxococcota bacterium]
MTESRPLARRVREELATPLDADAATFARAIWDGPGGDAIDALVFYGARRRAPERTGWLDFYAIVSDYRRFHAGPLAAWANARLAPHVFARVLPNAVAGKVAVVDWATLDQGCRATAWRPHLWSRFCQPLRLAHVRNAAAEDALVRAATTAIATALGFGVRAADAGTPGTPLTSERLWPALFRSTYACEWRPEPPETATALYAGDRAAFDGRFREGKAFREPSAEPLRRRRAKALAAAQLVKSAFTFGDWVPYALAKLERHSGLQLEASERQRRHPFLYAWPLFWRALRSGALR